MNGGPSPDDGPERIAEGSGQTVGQEEGGGRADRPVKRRGDEADMAHEVGERGVGVSLFGRIELARHERHEAAL